MSLLTIEEGLSWTTFAEQIWDRRPVLFKAVSPPPFVEAQVFDAAVQASHNEGSAPPPNVQLTVERLQQTRHGGRLPKRADESFDGYQARLGKMLDGQRYALVINGFHAFDHAMWARERTFFAGLWEQVGLPLSSAITTLFHGTYEHSPVGVHKDRFATFMFVLKGRKRMRFWAGRPWQDQVSTVLDYHDYLPDSFTAQVEAGDLLYWPSTYFHVGEGIGADPSTSVNIGVPREEHHARFELEDLLVDVDPEIMVGQERSMTAQLPPVGAAPFAPGAGGGQLAHALPAALDEAVQVFRGFGRDRRLDGRITELSLRRWSAGGFEPVPPPAERTPLPDDRVVRGNARSPILWAADGTGTVCAVNGHTVRTAASERDLRRLLEPLLSGSPVRVGELLPSSHTGEAADAADAGVLPGTRAGMRSLLEHLESFRGITRDHAS